MQVVILVLVIVFVLMGIFVSGYYAFNIACIRKKEEEWLDREQMEKTPYGAHYDTIVAAERWLSLHNAEDLYLQSDDGLSLHGLWVHLPGAKGTVVLVHGYRSTQLLDFGLVLDLYYKQGYNLLLPEQRCHGKSEGKYITFGVKESQDVLRWIHYHNDRFGALPIVLCGLSMGASTVMYLTDEKVPDNVRGIIADCGFTSPKEIISTVYKGITHLPPGPSLWVADLFARVFAGFRLTQKDSRRCLAGNKIPILIVHGTSDDYVPCDMSRQAFKACPGKKELLLVEGAGHGVSFLVDRRKYVAAINRLLKMAI